jgi:hypothetical protein
MTDCTHKDRTEAELFYCHTCGRLYCQSCGVLSWMVCQECSDAAELTDSAKEEKALARWRASKRV